MDLPYNWRVTKYNPEYRNAKGHYTVDEWTFFAQVGTQIAGREFTYEEYLATESSYVGSAMAFLADAELVSVQISELQNNGVGRLRSKDLWDIAHNPARVKPDSELRGPELEDVIRMLLREVLWCKLVSEDRFYLHFGWDYYMYVGSTSPSQAAIETAQTNGLFVEEMVSPYLQKWQ